MTKKFIELMHEFESTQSKYKLLLRERVVRQVFFHTFPPK